MFKAFFPGSGLYNIQPACPPLPFPWGRILLAPQNWGAFLSAETPLEKVELPEAVFVSFWTPSLLDSQLFSSFEFILVFDAFSFCVGGLVAGIHGHFFDKDLYGLRVKKRITKHPEELKWKSIIIPDEPYNFFDSKPYKTIKFLSRFFVGGATYLGIRLFTHIVFYESTFLATWISSVALMTLIGRRYSRVTLVSMMIASLWAGFGVSLVENFYSNCLDLINKNEITNT